jgi:hypothetical protein
MQFQASPNKLCAFASGTLDQRLRPTSRDRACCPADLLQPGRERNAMAPSTNAQIGGKEAQRAREIELCPTRHVIIDTDRAD